MTVYNVQNMSLEELEKTRQELWGTYQDAVCYTDMTEHPRHKTMWGETAREAWEDLKTVELVIRGRGGRAEMAEYELEPESPHDPDARAAQIAPLRCDKCHRYLYYSWVSNQLGKRYCFECFDRLTNSDRAKKQRGGAGGSKI